MSEKPLKIIDLRSQNVKRLKAVHIHPSGNVVVIGGQNGQGKTSVLDSIMFALGGKDAQCEQPIRNGQTRAEVNIDLGEFTVRRTFTEAGGELTLKSREGAKIASPQAILDRIAGKLSFDPLEFSRQKPKDQLETLRSMVGLDFTAHDAERKRLFDARADLNRRHKEAEAILKNAPRHDDAPKSEQSIADLSAKLAQAQDLDKQFTRKQGDYKTLKSRIETGKTVIAGIKEDIAKLQAKLAMADKQLADLEAEAVKVKAEAEAIPEYDLEAMQAQLANVEAVNAKVRQNAQHAQLASATLKLKQESDDLTAKIEKLDAEKAEKLSKAPFPVPGLGLGEHGVTFAGVPFSQASAAEQLRVSVAMGLAMNPRLRVMLIRDGSLLDENSLKLVAEMAAANDAQVWIERVGTGEEVSVVIEDGEVKGAAQAPIEQADTPAPKGKRLIEA